MPLYRTSSGGDGLDEAAVSTLIDEKITAAGVGGVQETGWRDISSLWASAGWAWYGYGPGHLIKIKRVGSQITLAGQAFGNIPDSPGYAEITMPEGFRPTVDQALIWPWQHDPNNRLTWIATTSKLRVSGYDGDVVSGECSWTTDDAWPTSLPGQAVA